MVGIPPAKEIEIPLTNEIKLRVRLVEPGEFTAGSTAAEAGPTAGTNPAVKTKVAEAFYLGVYEVTQDEYAALLKTNPSASRALRDGRRPVERVSWVQLRSSDGFIARLDARLRELDLPYRADLPTETEWEYACRAGVGDTAEGGGGGGAAAAALRNVAIFNSSEGVPSRVGERKPNAWGFYDMLGNIAEWTRDEPVLRGGNWRASATATLSKPTKTTSWATFWRISSSLAKAARTTMPMTSTGMRPKTVR